MPNDEQLTASQKYGVITQRDFMEKEDQKVALALAGIESFKHVDKDNFVISLRSFEGGIERAYQPGCITPAYTVLSCHDSCYPPFWAYLLKSSAFISMLSTLSESLRDGKAISYSSFSKSRLPLPPRPTQRAIAAFLDAETARIDGLVKEYEDLIALLAEKRTALISHAVTRGLSELVRPDDPEFGEWAKPVKFKDSGVEWIGEIPEGWRVDKLNRRVFFQEGPGIGLNDFTEEGIPLLRISGLKTNPASLEGCNYLSPNTVKNKWQHFSLDVGDILISGSASGDLMSVVGAEVAGSIPYTGIIRFKESETVTSAYLSWYLCSAPFQEQVNLQKTGATIQHFGPTHLRQVFIPVLMKSEQISIGAFLTRKTQKLETLINEARLAIELLKEHRAALITNAVTGKINVEGMA